MPTTIQFPSGSHVEVTAAPVVFDPSRTLCIAAAYANPHHWKSRLRLFREFRAYMATLPGVRLFVGELAYGKDKFQVTTGAPGELQLRAEQVLWHKENILNLVIQKRFPKNWRYGGYCDGDFHFSRTDLAAAAISDLKNHDWLQLFSDYTALNADQRFGSNASSFMWCRKSGKTVGWPKYGNVEAGAPGGAWAFRRSAFDAAGGLMDFCITGAADWYMALGVLGLPEGKHELVNVPGYTAAIHRWQKSAFSSVKLGVGFLQGHSLHFWHGPLSGRAYSTRHEVLKQHAFDPATDLYRNSDGVLQLVATKQAMADGILNYFAAMNGDE